MKASDKFELSASWWKAHKGKTVADCGLEDALKEFEKAKASLTNKGPSFKRLEKANKAILDVRVKVKAVADKCKTVLNQGDTKAVLLASATKDVISNAEKLIADEHGKLTRRLQNLANSYGSFKTDAETAGPLVRSFHSHFKDFKGKCDSTNRLDLLKKHRAMLLNEMAAILEAGTDFYGRTGWKRIEAEFKAYLDSEAGQQDAEEARRSREAAAVYATEMLEFMEQYKTLESEVEKTLERAERRIGGIQIGNR